MTGKRKRLNYTVVEESIKTPATPAKPISAIAAARLQLEAKLQSQNATTNEEVQDPATSPIVEATSDFSESELEEEELPIPHVHQNFKLCTWRKTPENVLSDTASELTVILEKHQTVSFVGCFDLKVLKGAVNINGANIGAVPRPGDTAKSFRAYVPSTHPITKIRGLDRTSHVQISSCEDSALFEAIGPLFGRIWATKKDKGRSFDFIQESDSDPLKRDLTPENAPEEWIRTIEDISGTQSTTLVVGSSLTGKSTFTKRLLNRYLSGFGKTAKAVPSVCYLDLDFTKPEYTPQGQISLSHIREVTLGPSFTHPAPIPSNPDKNEIIAAHAIPTHGLSDYEEYFTSCVSHLIQTYRSLRSQNPTLPLIINTPSQLYTTHFHLLETLLPILKPNNTIHLGNTSAIDTDAAEKLHTLLTLSTKQNSTLHELPAQPPLLPPSRTDAELSAMHMQSYFHLCSPDPAPEISTLPSWNPHPLTTTLTPWQFSYSESSTTRTQDFQAFLLFAPDPPSPTQFTTTLNGSIIYIISTNTSSISFAADRAPRTQIPYFPTSSVTHLPPTPLPASTKPICTALIHSFDFENHLVNVLVPSTHDSLLAGLEPETTILVGGCCDVPAWAYVEDAHKAFEARKRRVMEPWVEKRSVVEGMGYLGVGRRVRKFLG
ncbi:hypothetical protein DM02DRAFT_597186 [Periconia macrospinosa]|uniref:Polynucleotide 5'-hydroxyl-kinase GRC3 n=1 Tax=Periconia macrospinosa TaxID=97972 RepID=A0A2V1DKM2_9PLEO|nr:hypothetical protein DM02DRAFT_597186 [Periconia macrospinosa]